ncbi:MAG: hypothetical protein AMS19_02495 [Gemmatimonas sp. SG8_23]|nr:MAG: hypothetical protein AMS19_02495 [Gemmatimonas sp. SG8_23]
MIEGREFRRSSRAEVRSYLMEERGRTLREAGDVVREWERRFAGTVKTVGGGFVWTGSRWIHLEE